MAKQKTKNRKTIAQNIDVSFPDNISKEDMIDIISSAIVKANEKEKENEIKKQQKEDEEWHKKTGLKNYSDKHWFLRVFLTFGNTLFCLFRILFIKRKDITGNHATNGLLKIAVKLSFKIATVVLWILAISAILSYPLQSLGVWGNTTIPVSIYICLLPIALLFIILAQLFRIAEIEIDKMKDMNYIVALLAVILS